MITFSITFHGPFHVGTGTPEGGLDRPVRRDNPLPATSLKGLMRAEAAEVLDISPSLVAAVFGAPGRPGAWWWQDAVFDAVAAPDGPVRVGRAARIRVDDRGVVEDGFLALGEHIWAERATFAVGPLRALDADETARHTAILRAAARSVVALGGSRRRGEGWVSIGDDLGAWTAEDTRRLIACRSAS